jgi:tetratricopeptide (TPR) repeat protein
LEFNPLGKETERRVKQLVDRFPLAAPARYLHAQWAYARKESALCADELNLSLSLNPDDATRIRILTLLAVTAEDSGQVEKADTFFRDSYGLNRRLSFPDTRSALTFVNFLKRQQEDAEAQRMVEEILRFYPGLGAAHFSRARYFARTKQPDKAILEAQLALKDTGNNLDLLQSLHAFLAKTFFSMGNKDEARKHQIWVETHANE